jgi:hypothetical protein
MQYELPGFYIHQYIFQYIQLFHFTWLHTDIYIYIYIYIHIPFLRLSYYTSLPLKSFYLVGENFQRNILLLLVLIEIESGSLSTWKLSVFNPSG